MRRITKPVLGIPIDVVSQQGVVAKVIDWATEGRSKYICICNVHSVVTAQNDSEFSRILKSSDMNTADGVPLVWTLRSKGYPRQDRVAGPDLIDPLCEAAARNNISMFLYGSTPEVLDEFQKTLYKNHPNLEIAGAMSPPFRELSEKEKDEIVSCINNSGARVVWVGLGCPKQERWMWEHRGRIQAVMIGVGAAFDYQVGRISRAPVWMRRAGLEWAFRLMQEPRRLFQRYLKTNTLFIKLTLMEILSVKKFGK